MPAARGEPHIVAVSPHDATSARRRRRSAGSGARARRLRALLPSLCLLLPGCDEEGAPSSGWFDVVVGGATRATITGEAGFGRAGDGFLIELIDDDDEPTTIIRLLQHTSERPVPGHYRVGEPADEADFTAIFLQEEGLETVADLAGTVGTVTITSSSDERMRGEFDFEARGFLQVGGTAMTDARIDVTGEFEARAD